MKKIIELCVLVAVLLAFILYSCSNQTGVAEKERELFESQRTQENITEDNSDIPVEYEGI